MSSSSLPSLPLVSFLRLTDGSNEYYYAGSKEGLDQATVDFMRLKDVYISDYSTLEEGTWEELYLERIFCVGMNKMDNEILCKIEEGVDITITEEWVWYVKVGENHNVRREDYDWRRRQ